MSRNSWIGFFKVTPANPSISPKYFLLIRDQLTKAGEYLQ